MTDPDWPTCDGCSADMAPGTGAVCADCAEYLERQWEVEA